jgi:hypothetical protein|tara:strand:+ start:181 stop:381 length:201 start_codon:yes stop_codon:yes gene_type:complete
VGKKAIYDVFNAITGRWEQRMMDEEEFVHDMRKLDKEMDVLDAELEVVNRIIEQHLNMPEVIESKD